MSGRNGKAKKRGHTLLDSLWDLGGSGGVGDVTVLLGWVYLVGVDVLVGVGVVDLKVRLFYHIMSDDGNGKIGRGERYGTGEGRIVLCSMMMDSWTHGVGQCSLNRLGRSILDSVGYSRLSLGVGSVRLVGGHLVECFDLSSESTNNSSGAHQVIIVDRKEE